MSQWKIERYSTVKRAWRKDVTTHHTAVMKGDQIIYSFDEDDEAEMRIATLMVAMEDMLAALKTSARNLKGEVSSLSNHATLKIVRAAIAKAEGGAS